VSYQAIIDSRVRPETTQSHLRKFIGDQKPSKDPQSPLYGHPPSSQPTRPAASSGATTSVPRAATVTAASAYHSASTTAAQPGGEPRCERTYPGTAVGVTTVVRDPLVTVPVDPTVERSAYRRVVASSLPQPPRREDQPHCRAMLRRQWSLGRPPARRRSASPSDLYPTSTTRMFEECEEIRGYNEYR